jgi:molecular chaperone DnaJ
VNVRVPAGIDDGQLIRLAGRGEPGRNGGLPGDLFVVVRVAPHPIFGRDGSNLTLRLPVTYPEAVLGAEVKVPTLDGAPVTVRIPPGTGSGRVLRVRRHGVPRNGARGDLLVTVEVDVPSSLGAKERKAVEALAKALSGNPRAHLGV